MKKISVNKRRNYEVIVLEKYELVTNVMGLGIACRLLAQRTEQTFEETSLLISQVVEEKVSKLSPKEIDEIINKLLERQEKENKVIAVKITPDEPDE